MKEAPHQEELPSKRAMGIEPTTIGLGSPSRNGASSSGAEAYETPPPTTFGDTLGKKSRTTARARTHDPVALARDLLVSAEDADDPRPMITAARVLLDQALSSS